MAWFASPSASSDKTSISREVRSAPTPRFVGRSFGKSRARLLDGSGRADDDDVVFLLEGAHDALREHRVVVGYQDGDLAFASHSLPLFGGGYHRAFGRTGPRSRVLMPGRGCARNGR